MPGVTISAVVRWKNGDRQFIDTELVRGRPRDEVLWKVGVDDAGGHAEGEVVLLRLLSLNGSTAGGRVIFVEYP